MIKVIWSQDELLATEVVDDTVASAKDAEVISIDAETGLDGLDEAIFAGSLFASERVVIIRNTQVLRKADVERLADVLQRGDVPWTVLVVAVSERIPSALADAMKPIAKIERLQRPRRGELVNWVVKRMKYHGLNGERDVAPTFVEAVGDNLRELDQAISQITLRAGGRKVAGQDVLAHFTPQSEQPMWALFDAIVKHDGQLAFSTLRRLFAHGEDALPMLGAIISQVRGIMKTKGLIEREPTITDRDVAKTFGLTEGRVGVMRRQCSRLSWDWLVSVHRLLAQADFELKGGEDGAVLPAEVVLERVVAGALDAG